ncbi:transporter [Mycobacterium asiaticum]|uniref:Transporter n=1 Tax=Mycobacterium asiaticum TaxID=1790 RepID=A0A1A3N9V2_MYCAS|nr:amino acid permease [Mycobacterium asiaticum]OBK18943.1 transporter [Mycobacterium asiaticum]
MQRRLGVGDAVIIGLSSMLGAGIFAALAPAARAGGAGLLIGLAVAGVVAYCNATSSARLAALYPASGGTYVYGRQRLGEFWGYLAGWGFVVGKTASCAAMALTVGWYAWPAHAHVVAVAAVVVLTVVNYLGVRKSMWLSRSIVVAVLLVLAAVVAAVIGSRTGDLAHLSTFRGVSAGGVLQSAGLLFFAFAGYARIATLGEEVRNPARTIPRAIGIALAITLLVYAAVAVAVLIALGPNRLAVTARPLVEAARATGFLWLLPFVAGGAVLAALGSLLSLLLGVSRTTLAMARDGNLPRRLDAIHPRFGVPHRAELAVGTVAAVLAVTVDLRGAIGFSSFAVLVYYAIANASAMTLRPDEGPPVKAVPVLGLLGCVVVAFALPLTSVIAGAGVLVLGATLFWVRSRWRA